MAADPRLDDERIEGCGDLALALVVRQSRDDHIDFVFPIR